MTLPNFLMIGAMKAGTTSLYRYLKQHPQIFMSPVKEPNFFALEGEALDDPRVSVTDIKAYQALFNGVTDELAIGEASVRYLYSPKAAERIQHHIPDAKLIAVLRDPVERAFSAYVYQYSRGSDLSRDFGEALRLEPERIQKNYDCWWHYQSMGFYYAQLKPYYERFDPSQIKVYLYEDVCDRLQDVVQNIFQFLGVDDQFKPDLQKRHNSTHIPKNQSIHNFLTKPHPVKEFIKPLFSQALRYKIVKGLRTRNLTRHDQSSPTSRTVISPEIRIELIEAYQDDILNLQELIQRDLSKWLTN
ncbi:MAG TPA: sulfotransferase family protein [Elainellaceae cyanobacterium]